MLNEKAVRRSYAVAERRGRAKAREILRDAEKRFIAKLPEDQEDVPLRQFERDVREAFSTSLKLIQADAMAFGIQDADRELRQVIRDEGVLESEVEAVLGRPSSAVMWFATDRNEVRRVQLGEAEALDVATALDLQVTEAMQALRKRATFFAKRAGKKAATRLRRAMRKLLAGETWRDEAVKAVQKTMKTTRAHAMNVVRTETTWAYASGRAEIGFSTRGVTHFRFRGVRDRRQSDICESRTGKVWKKTDRKQIEANSPPLHGHCRSTWELILGVLPSQKKIVNDKRNQPRTRKDQGYVPVPKGWKPSSASAARRRPNSRSLIGQSA